jgi:predicted nucleic acid-binding protein
MAVEALVDAGAILALLDRNDRWHSMCMATFPKLRLPLVTSEAVLTELFYMVADSRPDTDAAWKLVRSGAIRLEGIKDSELPDIQMLMAQYWDRPMDFADATLVHLARREGLSTIFTIDHADFQTYRIDGRRRFRILPAPPLRSGFASGASLANLVKLAKMGSAARHEGQHARGKKPDLPAGQSRAGRRRSCDRAQR